MSWTILTAHSVGDGPAPVAIPLEVFRAQLDAIAAAGRRTVPLGELVRWARGEGASEERGVVLTFDDGYADFAVAAWPELRARGFGCTLFLPAARLGGLSGWPGMRGRAARLPLLDPAAVARLADQGVEIGAHGLTHRDLSRCPLEEAEHELAAGRRLLEERCGAAVEHLAYPYGRSSPPVRAAAQRHYRAAVGTRMASADRAAPLYDLPRVDLWYFRRPARLRRLLEAGETAYFHARRWLREIREKAAG